MACRDRTSEYSLILTASRPTRDPPPPSFPPTQPYTMIVNPLRIFATLFLVAVGVSAQDACILGCLQGSVSPNTCPDISNVTCLCTNSAFQAATAACLQANCTAADQASALALQQSQCASLSSSSSSSSTSRSPSSGTSSSTASSPTSSSGAVHDQVPFLNAAFALAGVALGGAFIL
ncbi:hypothetical protein BJY52DRAFT_1293796 [Lactarius psammicola]|nr:hypothetical protein BJY52DRAFT_1293796 [Lactarius psammicola]